MLLTFLLVINGVVCSCDSHYIGIDNCILIVRFRYNFFISAKLIDLSSDTRWVIIFDLTCLKCKVYNFD